MRTNSATAVDNRRLEMQPPWLEQPELRGKADPPIGPPELLVQDQGAGAMLLGVRRFRLVADKGQILLE
jgi:hypothetical protein